jgi:hypothetical protein
MVGIRDPAALASGAAACGLVQNEAVRDETVI